MSTAKELLSLDYYSNLVGQFSLSNVWVQMVPWRWAGKVALVTSVGPWSHCFFFLSGHSKDGFCLAINWAYGFV
jgi:hypothetical protein